MFILVVHYKKDTESDITYYTEHLINKKTAYRFGGPQFETGMNLSFESKMVYKSNNKYIVVEEVPTKKEIYNYEKHELIRIDDYETN